MSTVVEKDAGVIGVVVVLVDCVVVEFVKVLITVEGRVDVGVAVVASVTVGTSSPPPSWVEMFCGGIV